MKDNWKAQRSIYYGGKTFIVAQGDQTIANNIQRQETALLMAAAPDLLAALHDIMDDWITRAYQDINRKDPDTLRRGLAASAAIAKAEGIKPDSP